MKKRIIIGIMVSCVIVIVGIVIFSTINSKISSEQFVKQFYKKEVTGTVDELNGYYYDSNNANFGSLKNKLKEFKVKKIEFVKVVSKEKNKNLEVMACIYRTYFKGTEKPKNYVEVFSLINEKEKWYIINNYKDMPDEDIQWVRKNIQKQRNLLYENKEVQQMLKK